MTTFFECAYPACPQPPTRVNDKALMKSHIAMDHLDDAFHTHRCGHCKRMFYDVSHFMDHAQKSPTCNPISLNVEPLSEHVQKMFDALIDQWPITEIPPQPSTPAISLSSSTPKAMSICKDETPMDIDMGELNENEVITLDDDDEEDRKDINAITLMTPLASNKSNKFPPMEIAPAPEPVTQTQTPAAKKPAPKSKSKSAKGDRKPPSKGVSTVPSPAVRETRTSTRVRSGALEEPSVTETRKVPDVTPTLTSKSQEKRVKKETGSSTKVMAPRSCKVSPKKYRVASDSENDGDGENSGERENLDRNGKELLNLCQLCVELQNNRAPMFKLEEKKAHALIHLKFAPIFERMSDEEARRQPEFMKVFYMCFEDGFYDDLKRQAGINDADMD